MDVDDLDVVVWPESEEREMWWRQVVTVGCADAASAPMTPNRSVQDTSSRILHAA
ncbi:hypothetical protein [Rhodococcus sp. (in: high G+C Gram-positive bacteria)]|uniref:hypothetical protein n=1 Tax=Rhodococcus sp. TaxID=1831 RepID=UPI0025805A21|nr:hypothetical protein [Rhodococcus sp. (in: high G+C Gram-positive bacteria)]MBQ7805030.1 hypothetical protein [Rhodococcus sp. (in: high G+C Gram-positive bacteria)]